MLTIREDAVHELVDGAVTATRYYEFYAVIDGLGSDLRGMTSLPGNANIHVVSISAYLLHRFANPRQLGLLAVSVSIGDFESSFHCLAP